MRDDIKIPWQEQVVYVSIFLLVLVFLAHVRHSIRPDYNQQAIQAIVGEASNQTEDTMICVAHALRNRGSLKGVYGLHAKHIWNEPARVWKNAALAWDISAHEPDVVQGAKNFGTQADLDHYGHWAIKTQCGDFYFY